MEVRIETLAAIRVARIRHVGPYEDIGPCFERLLGWAADSGSGIGRVLSLSHDNPETTSAEELRSDACVEVPDAVAPKDGIVLEFVGGGRYAIHTYRGPYQGLRKAYRRLFEAWLPGSGEAVDDRPCMEIYRNSPLDTPAVQLVTDICLPLRNAPEH